MSEQEILLAAIKKAESNGFVMDKHKHFCEIGRNVLTGDIETLGAYQSIIFDHDFAKSFWGEKILLVCSGCDSIEADKPCCPDGRIHTYSRKAWAYHLQQMVLEKDPIKYLEKLLWRSQSRVYEEMPQMS